MAKARPPVYPFVPKSNAHLRPGQFFSFRLANGRYACGRVLGTVWPLDPKSRTVFQVGLMDWCGESPATADDLIGRGVLEQGWAHPVILQDYAATIDGCRPLDADGLAADPTATAVYGREVLRILAHTRFSPSPAG